MSHTQSAQSPSADPQPPKQESYLSNSNPVSKDPSESQEASSHNASHSHTSGLGREETGGSSFQSQSQSETHTLKNTLDKQRADEKSSASGSEELKEGGANGDRETEQVKMAPPSEGKVARSVEGTRDSAREMQHREGGGGHVQSGERGVKYGDLGLGSEHGKGQGHGDVGQGQGREMGAGLERKKAQQSSDREQVKEARSEGQDVDGGSFGARPHAEVD
ncbi:hypothetical protein QBC37DRAFT_375503 [Rhypophila decipiens]|uniref:Uncharacterized protein n=1 Tax=Rhypophila decipiens TaxID=261697 RepID=A0AAN7B6N4_9PEZI|nr:hypothetical protein QBC37DRAFT_375503 [Rhypophila decipiens]